MEETGFLGEERSWIDTFLSKRACKDVWREFNPGVRKYTFWDQKRCISFITKESSNKSVMREKNYGWRIDVFYANEKMMEDVISSDILNNVYLCINYYWLQIMSSDHCPISLTFKNTLSGTFPIPPGAGNIRKDTKQQVVHILFCRAKSGIDIIFSNPLQEAHPSNFRSAIKEGEGCKWRPRKIDQGRYDKEENPLRGWFPRDRREWSWCHTRGIIWSEANTNWTGK